MKRTILSVACVLELAYAPARAAAAPEPPALSITVAGGHELELTAIATTPDAAPADGIASSPVVSGPATSPPAATPPVVIPMPTPPFDPYEHPGAFIAELYRAATSGQWLIVAGLVLLGVSLGLRLLAVKVWSWFATTLGALVLTSAVGFTAYLGGALAAGVTPGWTTIAAAAGSIAISAGLWQWAKKRWPVLGELFADAKAERAAAKAAKA